MDVRGEFFAQRDQLAPQPIELRIPLYDAQQLQLVEEDLKEEEERATSGDTKFTARNGIGALTFERSENQKPPPEATSVWKELALPWRALFALEAGAAYTRPN